MTRLNPTVRNGMPWQPRLPLGEWLLTPLITAIALFSIYLFAAYVVPSRSPAPDLRIGADSDFYLWHAGIRPDVPDGYSDKEDMALLSLGSNVLGPEIIARVFRTPFMILCANVFLFVLSIRIFAANTSLRVVLFALLLLLNPSVLVSILTLNKEIITLLSVAILFHYLNSKRRSWLELTALLAISLLGRWENLAVVGLFLILISVWSPLRSKRKTTLLGLAVCLTVIYSVLYAFVATLLQADELPGDTIAILSSAQEHFLYFAVALPKIALNLFGSGIAFLYRGAKLEVTNDVYNSLIVPLSSLVNLAVTLWFFVARRVSLDDDRLYFIALYLLIFAVMPFIQPRYFLPQYYFVCFELSRRDSLNQSALLRWRTA
jgi:hypothetical protein